MNLIIKKHIAKIFFILLVFSYSSKAEETDSQKLVGSKWGCTVILCLATSKKPFECIPPVKKLITHLRKGKAFPSCKEDKNRSINLTKINRYALNYETSNKKVKKYLEEIASLTRCFFGESGYKLYYKSGKPNLDELYKIRNQHQLGSEAYFIADNVAKATENQPSFSFNRKFDHFLYFKIPGMGLDNSYSCLFKNIRFEATDENIIKFYKNNHIKRRLDERYQENKNNHRK